MQKNKATNDITVKFLNEHYSKDKDIKNLIAYIAGQGKNKETERVSYIGYKGLPKCPRSAAERIIATQKIHRKDYKRRLYHAIISFPDCITDKKVVEAIGEEVSSMIYNDGYSNYCGLHTSSGNLHLHFAINAVNYRSGKKWHKSKSQFIEYKKEIELKAREVLSNSGMYL